MKYGLPINFFKEYMCDHIWWNSYINNDIVNENKDIWKSQLVKSLYYDDNVEIHIDIIKGEPTVQDFQKVSEKYLKKYLQIPNTFQKYLDTNTNTFAKFEKYLDTNTNTLKSIWIQIPNTFWVMK